MKNFLALIIGTFFGTGFIPPCPGTWGTIGGALFYFFFLRTLPSFYKILLFILVFILGVWASGILVQRFQKKDPDQVVIDEVLGIWITLFFAHSFFSLLAGIILFRIFDIWKPLGIKKVERAHNGLGIMLDDVLAGFYSLILLLSLQKIFPLFS